MLLTATSYPMQLQKTTNFQRFLSLPANDFKRNGFLETRVVKNLSSRLFASCEGAPTGLLTLSLTGLLTYLPTCLHTDIGQDKFADTKLYPPVEPFEKGLLKVSDIHSIAYSVYGNKNGKLTLH